MKTIALLAITLLMFSTMTSLVLAEENETVIVELDDSTDQIQLEEDGGIGPGSRMYWLDDMGDRIRFAFAFGNARKAQVGLEIAEEKLAEIEALDGADPELIERARSRYERYVERATENMEKVEARTENKTGEAVGRLEEMRNRLELHHEKSVQTRERILEKHAENMTEEQLNQLRNVFGKIENRTLKAREQLNQKEDRLRSIYQLRNNITGEEAEDFFEGIRSEHQEEIREEIRKRISENELGGQGIRSRMDSDDDSTEDQNETN